MEVAVTPNGRYACVANSLDNRLLIIDVDAGKVIASVPTQTSPQGVTITPDSIYAYVANYGSDSVSVVDIAQARVAATIRAGMGPVSLAIAPPPRSTPATPPAVPPPAQATTTGESGAPPPAQPVLGHLRYTMPAVLAIDSNAFSTAPQTAPSAPAAAAAPEGSTSPEATSSEGGFSLSFITDMIPENLAGLAQGPVIYAIPGVIVLGLAFLFLKRRRSKRKTPKGDVKEEAVADEEMALTRTGRSARRPV